MAKTQQNCSETGGHYLEPCHFISKHQALVLVLHVTSLQQEIQFGMHTNATQTYDSFIFLKDFNGQIRQYRLGEANC